MKIHASSSSPETAVIRPGSREEQRAIVDNLPLKDFLLSQSRLMLQRMVGRSPEISVSHDALTAMVGNIYWDDKPYQQVTEEVHTEVTSYLASNQPQPHNPGDLHLV